MALNDLCFVDMPFGMKTDPTSGVEIDFDQIYTTAIKPAIEAVRLEALRGHAARPFTTVPIFATIHGLPFDIALIRAVPYQLEDGRLGNAEAGKLRSAIEARLRAAIDGPPANDSPIFQLIPDFPVTKLPHEVTETFQDRVRHSDAFNAKLTEARRKPSKDERRAALVAIQEGLGDLKVIQRNILVELLLSYRAIEAWPEMVALAEAMPDPVQDLAVVRQQRALALNRCQKRDQAQALLEGLIATYGPDPETLGILGRVHKDRYKDAKAAGSIIASAALDDAIDAYRKGFEADPRDYYPGVNAITLLIEKGDEDALNEADRLVPLVSFAVARRGGAKSSDYWDLATVLELACIAGDWAATVRVLPRVIAAADEPWMAGTTQDNLTLLKNARDRQGLALPQLDAIIAELAKRRDQLAGKVD